MRILLPRRANLSYDDKTAPTKKAAEREIKVDPERRNYKGAS